MTQYSIDDFVSIQKENHILLKEIMATQNKILMAANSQQEDRKSSKRWTYIKYGILSLLTIWSFMYTKQLMSDLMGSMTGDSPTTQGGSNLNIDDLLKGKIDPELQNELDNYF